MHESKYNALIIKEIWLSLFHQKSNMLKMKRLGMTRGGWITRFKHPSFRNMLSYSTTAIAIEREIATCCI